MKKPELFTWSQEELEEARIIRLKAETTSLIVLTIFTILFLIGIYLIVKS